MGWLTPPLCLLLLQFHFRKIVALRLLSARGEQCSLSLGITGILSWLLKKKESMGERREVEKQTCCCVHCPQTAFKNIHLLLWPVNWPWSQYPSSKTVWSNSIHNNDKHTHTLTQSPVWMYFFKKETLSFIGCLLDLRNHVQREIWLAAVAIIQHKKNAVLGLWIDLMCPGSVSALHSQWDTCEFRLCNSTTDSPAPVVLKWPRVSLKIPFTSACENVPVTMMVLLYHRTFCILFAQNKTWVINKGYTISELLLMSLSTSMIMYYAALNNQFRLWEALYLSYSIQCSINVITFVTSIKSGIGS